MTSVLRELQAEWNAMVPAAQARGIRRVRLLGQGDVNRGPLEAIAYRRAKVEWLRAMLGGSSSLAGFDSLTFGVEIECILPPGTDFSEAARFVTQAGVPCVHERYGHTVPQGRWKVVTDGSLGNVSRGAEFVSPPLRGEDGFRQLKTVCDALTAMRAKITSRCGLHVHVGVGSEGPAFFKSITVLYSSAQQAIDTFMPDSRRGSSNVFCQPVQSAKHVRDPRSVQDVVRAIGQDTSARSRTRYCKLNLQSYFAYGTVEFRHHGGTTDAVKATNWVRLCLRMVLAAKAGEREVSTVDELMDAVDADEAERQYFRSRVAYFNRGRAADHFTSYGEQTHRRAGYVEGGW